MTPPLPKEHPPLAPLGYEPEVAGPNPHRTPGLIVCGIGFVLLAGAVAAVLWYLLGGRSDPSRLRFAVILIVGALGALGAGATTLARGRLLAEKRRAFRHGQYLVRWTYAGDAWPAWCTRQHGRRSTLAGPIFFACLALAAGAGWRAVYVYQHWAELGISEGNRGQSLWGPLAFVAMIPGTVAAVYYGIGAVRRRAWRGEGPPYAVYVARDAVTLPGGGLIETDALTGARVVAADGRTPAHLLLTTQRGQQWEQRHRILIPPGGEAVAGQVAAALRRAQNLAEPDEGDAGGGAWQ